MGKIFQLKHKWNVQQSAADRQILIQSVIMFVLLIGITLAFYFGDAIRPIFSATNQYYVYYAEYIMGDVVFGINPFLYLAFNAYSFFLLQPFKML